MTSMVFPVLCSKRPFYALTGKFVFQKTILGPERSICVLKVYVMPYELLCFSEDYVLSRKKIGS